MKVSSNLVVAELRHTSRRLENSAINVSLPMYYQSQFESLLVALINETSASNLPNVALSNKYTCYYTVYNILLVLK